MDAVDQNIEVAREKTNVLCDLGVTLGEYILATSHRQENVDDKSRFAGIFKGLQLVQKELKIPLIYPVHPRAKKMLSEFDLDTQGITLVEPLDYLSFLLLESKAKLVLTDSGGVQEETCILKVPCVTLRDNTERPETITVGANILAGTDPVKILTSTRTILSRQTSWVNPFGDGTTGRNILEILESRIDSNTTV